MSISALLMMVSIKLVVTVTCAYYFWRVLRAPHRAEPDSYEANDTDQ